MTAPVDVLAVLDEAIRKSEAMMPHQDGGANEHPVHFVARMADLRAARAAVAELIAAADAVARARIDQGACDPHHGGHVALANKVMAANERFRAALAACKGGAP